MSNVDDFLKAVRKSVGENSEQQAVTSFVDTGFPLLNKIISGSYDGGIPVGRLTEIYGPASGGKTAIATQCMIQTQKMGGIAIFIDWERTYDIDMAIEMGLNTEAPFWFYFRPRTWEEGNSKASKLCGMIRESKVIPDDAPICVIYDSIAQACPRSTVDKSMDELNMNDSTALSRVTATTLKTQAVFASDYNAAYIYLNQIRTKIGVMFGDPTCLRGDVTICFADGTSASIEDVVKNKMEKEVWTINEDSGEFEKKRIINWFNNGVSSDSKKWFNIKTNAVGTKNGVMGGTFTENHLLLTDSGWKEASNIAVGDKLISKRRITIDGYARDFLIGVLNFDATLAKRNGESGSTRQLVLTDNNNVDYCKWKVDKLSKHLSFKEDTFANPNPTKRNGEDFYKYKSEWSNELKEYDLFHRSPIYSFEHGMSPIQLAIMIMDDGSFRHDSGTYSVSIKRMAGDVESIYKMCNIFGKMGLGNFPNYGCGKFSFTKEASEKIARTICTLVPPCMQYKLPKHLQGKYVDFDLNDPIEVYQKKFVDVIGVEDVSGSKRCKGAIMYDLQIEDNSNYLVGNPLNGFIVHNCTPGGSAMEFSASVRLAISRENVFKEVGTGAAKEKILIGQNIKLKCVKSKLTRPFGTCSARMNFDDRGVAHFDNVTSLVDYLIIKGKLPFNGKTVEWNGLKLSRAEVIRRINDANECYKLVDILKSDAPVEVA